MDYHWKDRIHEHDFIIDGVLTHPFESIHIGNGDIGGSVFIYPHEIKFMLAKSDIWDARRDADPTKGLMTQDDLIDFISKSNRDYRPIWGEKNPPFEISTYNGNTGHIRGAAPRRACTVRMYHPGLSNTKVKTRVRLADGVVECIFHFAEGELIVRAFIEKENSRFWLETESRGIAPWFSLIVEKEPEETISDIPNPVSEKLDEHLALLTQTIPEGFDIDEFNWYVAAKFPDGYKGRFGGHVEQFAWKFRQFYYLESGRKAVLCVGIATDRDELVDGVRKANHKSNNAKSRALSLVGDEKNFNSILTEHQRSWERFWDASNIAIEDKEMESLWYRNHFGYGCAMRRDMTPLGSAGNVVVNDYIPWNGDIHTNHNFQKWYCTAFPTNHPEWIDVYADFVNDKTPVFEDQAKLIFGLEGVFVDLAYYPIMARGRSVICNYFGRSLAHAGWFCQPLWWHWEYMKDEE